MKCYVITHIEVEGLHCWKDAKFTVQYLKHRHRHIFTIECEFEVSHNDRDVEIIMKEHELKRYFRNNYGDPAEFGEMSCEMIAEEIVENFDKCVSCKVLEDGRSGAICRR